VQRAAVFQPEFREDLRYWVETDRKIALRVLTLVVYLVSRDRIDFLQARYHY
jgi:toxin YoeB